MTDASSDVRTELIQVTALEERQLALLRVLIEKSEALARMYVGALRARTDDGNPEYLSQACHSIRELIDNLPKYFAVPVQPTGSLKVEVNTLRDAWQREKRVKNSTTEQLSEK